MDATGIRQALEDFVSEALTDRRSGVPADAKLTMDWATGPHGLLIGHLPEGKSTPTGGLRTRVIDMSITFNALTPEREAREHLARLTESLTEDPHLGGRVHPGHVRLREVEFEDTEAGDWQAVVTVAVGTVE